MHGFAEILAAPIKRREEYGGTAPPVALLPWFVAGSFFPISVMPAALTAIATVLPVTHALALMRYGLIDRNGHGLHDIWGLTNTTTVAALSLAVVIIFGVAVLGPDTRVFTRAAISRREEPWGGGPSRPWPCDVSPVRTPGSQVRTSRPCL